MKNKITVALAGLTLLALTVTARAYVSNAPDPTRGEGETEYRVVKKSETAGFSDAIEVGDVLLYDTVNVSDGYTVTRVGANNAASTNRIACIAMKAIATGDTGLYRCQSKGYTTTLQYDITTHPDSLRVGEKLCASADGDAVPCGQCTTGQGNVMTDCRFGNATENSPITAMEAKGLGTSGTIKAVINAQ